MIDRDDPDDAVLDEAARVLRAGGLVAFATETVYGLGADATNREAVARIFETKGRPATNPLIVHADGVPMARDCVAEWPEAAAVLADRFWPGPLTLVLSRSGQIPEIVTAGQGTVGVRVPEPVVARELIERLGRPIAAPSANRSTGVSPTLAKHVRKDLEGRVDLILDSGQTTVGLESTVLDLTTRHPHILRPGPVTDWEIEQALGGVRVRAASGALSPRSPGQMAIHYAPVTRAIHIDVARLEGFSWPDRAVLIVLGRHDLPAVPRRVVRYHLDDPDEAARELYVLLHACDEMRVGLIVVVTPPGQPEWDAIRDRIGRATRTEDSPRRHGEDRGQ